jgi:hypothetical protein
MWGTSEDIWGVDIVIVEHAVIMIQQVLYYKCLLVQKVVSYGTNLMLVILI